MSIALIKVCCIGSLTEAKTALSLGASWLGLVSEMPSGPGVISLERIADIVAGLPRKTKTVLLTSKLSCDEILAQHSVAKTWGIQLVDMLPESELKKLRKSLPETHLIQVVHVADLSSISQALSYAGQVDYILLDSGKPDASIKTLGGTGLTHDWDLSRQICEESLIPVFLAGGLNHENISEAISKVHPHGFDLCSGVRTDGNLDDVKLKKFMDIALRNDGGEK